MTHHDILNINPDYAALGFGLMRLPSADETARMVDQYMDAGFNYFDTAYVYGGSEEKFKKAISSRFPRDSYLIANKLPPWSVSDHKSCDKILDESLKRCGIDYFDFYLVHSLDENNEKSAVKAGVYEWVSEQKKKGKCKHIGFSFHGTAELLEHLLTTHTDMEFVQLQLNYIDILRGRSGEFHEIALKHKKPIIVMEPVKGGTLANLPSAAEAIFKSYAPDASVASWAVRYAASLKGATCLLAGMSHLSQMEDNLKTYRNFKPILKEELVTIEKVLLEMSKVATIPCTSCKYCVEDCPQNIDIPVNINLYNDVKRGSANWNVSMHYSSLPKGTKASDCTNCGVCVPRCPQHIDIPAELKTVAKFFK